MMSRWDKVSEKAQMMDEKIERKHKQAIDWWKIIGITLLLAGAALFFETRLHTGWLYYIPFLILISITIWTGIKAKQKRAVFYGIGFSAIFLILAIFWKADNLAAQIKLGAAGFVLSLAWALFVIAYRKFENKIPYWAILLSGVFAGVGGGFIWREAHFVDFVLWVCAGAGLPLLIWGYSERYFGLLIAGSLILTSGLGVYLGWGTSNEQVNSLTRTGVMLITFALGWCSISVLSRRCFEKVAWWALIPAGVLLMSGGGLFIGGSATSSKAFIGNTISIALIVLGIYVLLLRSGFNKNQQP